MVKTLRQASFQRLPTGASSARRLIADALRGLMTEEERLDFVLAVGEAISNAVRHGGGQTFSIRCSANGSKIIVDVIDQGTGFRRRPIKPPIDGASGGFGMLVIHKLADEVHLLDGGRNVRLVKRLPIVPAMPERAG